MHASDAAALFFTADEDEEIEDDISIDDEGRGEEPDSGWELRGGSPVDEGDQEAIPVVSYLLFLKEEFYY